MGMTQRFVTGKGISPGPRNTTDMVEKPYGTATEILSGLKREIENPKGGFFMDY
jgi:hypothetical protein